MTALSGHTSPETAYVVADYPYGYKLRTQIRYWIEHKPKHGFRFMSQTMNPKTGKWNKPKASTYHAVMVMTLEEENGHVSYHSATEYTKEPELDAYEAQYADAFTEEHRRAVKYLRARHNAFKHVTYTVVPASDTTTPRQTLEEQGQIIRRLIAHEYKKLA